MSHSFSIRKTQIQRLLHTHVLLPPRPPFSSQPNKMQSQLYCLHLVLLLMTQSSQCQVRRTWSATKVVKN
ncbi:hypothetical protein UPYG_G00339390 [Umbra pygmaea]|uniref:Uncharacterized protein n=1 Tax=Umbra pygmaea TaxID=75934 RepID=A0ABD0VXI6_UMBPY